MATISNNMSGQDCKEVGSAYKRRNDNNTSHWGSKPLPTSLTQVVKEPHLVVQCYGVLIASTALLITNRTTSISNSEPALWGRILIWNHGH